MSTPISKLTRREFLKVATRSVAFGAFGGFGLHYLFNIAPQELTLETVEVKLARLPRAFDGMTIAQLSDLHHGPFVDIKQIEHAVALANEAKPDVVVITGDFVGMSARYMKPCVEALTKLRAPLGVYGVFGNHDYFLGYIEASMAAIDAGGIRLMQNEWVRLTQGAEQIALVGVDDVSMQVANVRVAVRGLADELCKIVLVHEPDYADEVAKEKVDLQLSGHSHGGQVKIPGIGPIIVPRFAEKYVEGLYRVGDMLQVYTTRGVGVIQPAVRFNCPPEVTVIRLRSRV